MNATITLAGADWLLPLVGSLLLASMSLILLRRGAALARPTGQWPSTR